MDKNLKAIFQQNIELIEYADKVILYYRIQNYSMALRYTKSVIEIFTDIVDSLLENKVYFNKGDAAVDVTEMIPILSNLLKVQEDGDYILLADLYELQLMPLLLRIQENIISKEKIEFDEGQYADNLIAIEKKESSLAVILKNSTNPLVLLSEGYVIEYTSCGLITLAVTRNDRQYYIHSNSRIMQEAYFLSKEWEEEGIEHYVVYGLGLGYHIKELAETNPWAVIDVYEHDINIINLACAYTDFIKLIELPNVNVIYDRDFCELSKQLDQITMETTFLIHYPSIINIEEKNIRNRLEEYFIQQSSIKNQKKFMDDNFKNNIHNYDKPVDELKGVFAGKDLYIVAAGPSLDKNYHELKKIEKNGIILSTSTVFRKLLEAGIRPDFFIATDATQASYVQLKGLEQVEIPFIGMSTTYKEFMKNYTGIKYMICQNGYQKAEEFAKEKGYGLYLTGGSVSTAALDIGIKMNCRRIIFVGLDLAFTNDIDHASGTSTREFVDVQKAIPVEDINGDIVYTSRNLNIYRKWIENRIIGIKGIEFIDATEGGVKIKGMKIKKLSETIEESC